MKFRLIYKKIPILFFILATVCVGCGPDIIDDVDPPLPPGPSGNVNFTLDADTIVFSSLKSTISVCLRFEDVHCLSKLSVVKRGERIDTLMVFASSQLDSLYRFEYAVKETDERAFELAFIAYKKDAAVGTVQTVYVTDAALPSNEVKLTLSTDTIAYNEEIKTISVSLSFEKRYNLQELQIKKEGVSAIYQTVKASEIDSSFLFNYQVKKEDPNRFTFTFQAIDCAGKVSSSKELLVGLEGIYISNLVRLSRVTGKTLPGETFLNPNRTAERYDLGGTDLGIMWEMDPGKVGIFFGDSYGSNWITTEGGGPGVGNNWRSNVLAFSEDNQLNDGMKFSRMALDKNGKAREIIYSAKSGTDFTSIPTGAIRANGVDYVHYFNLRTWDRWTTNYSSLCSSSDNGETWKPRKEVTFSTNSRFAMVGYAKKDGYVYMVGTPSGRLGKAYLSRFLETDILNKNQYEYWNGDDKQWIKNDETKATPLWDKNVGELSLMYHEKYKRWIIAYSAGEGDIHAMLFRDAKEITGPWTKAKILVDGTVYPGLYGPFMHPVKNKEDKLYFNMSQWWPYNVFFMGADMSVFQ